MNTLSITSSNSTPSVWLDKHSGKFTIRGVSVPENCIEFYDPVLIWVREYCEAPNDKTNFEFNMEFMNTASSKMITQIIMMLEEIHKKGAVVMVTWLYLNEDHESAEFANSISSMLKIPFDILPLG